MTANTKRLVRKMQEEGLVLKDTDRARQRWTFYTNSGGSVIKTHCQAKELPFKGRSVSIIDLLTMEGHLEEVKEVPA